MPSRTSLPFDLSHALAGIYDAALEPDRWEEALRRIAEAFGVHQALMIQRDFDQPAETIVTCGLDMAVVGQWQGCKEHVDVWLQRVFDVRELSAYQSTDLISTPDLRRTGFHADILRPLNIEHSLGGLSENNERAQSFVAIYGSSSRGAFTALQRRRYEVLLPHIRRSMQVGRMLSRERRQGGAAESPMAAMDRLPVAVFFVEGPGRLVAMNATGHEMLSRRVGLVLDGHRLRGATPVATKMLERVIVAATQRSQGETPDAQEGTVLLARPSGGTPLRAVAVPLNPGLPVRAGAIAALFVTDPEANAIDDLPLLGRLFSLTPMEARVAARLVNGETVQEMAAALQLSTNTVRWHLKHVLQKADAKTQAQFVSRVLRSPAWLRRRG
jgi:DNA-binding CsgD family transcriptional regulator